MIDENAYDVVVVGAGFSGLYAIHRVRQLGLRVRCFEAGDGVGGTWYWNRYPGARVDIESMQYSYSFDDGLQQEWRWPEYFSPQEDLEAYANHVADRFGLRSDIELNARVNRLAFDERANRWHVSTENGHHVTAKYIVAATGSLDAMNLPPFPGLESFGGQWYHTARWPKEGVRFDGKRVGLIGTGSTGIQATPVIAQSAEHLFVFQRTAAYSLPAYNRPTDPAYERAWKADYPQRRAKMFGHFAASYTENDQYRSVFDYSPEERQRILEEAWAARNGLLFMRTFSDISTNLEANEIVAEFVRGKIRATVRDPKVAELLCPTTYPIGAKRICMDTGYFEAFNRDNVTLVDVRANPLAEITPTGLRTTADEYDLDIIVFATGFDAVTGSLTRMNVTGLGGLDLREKWRDGPTTFLGFLVAGFPNLFMIHGPGSPGVLVQMITGGEWQVDYVTKIIEDMERSGRQRIDTAPEWEQRWNVEVEEAAKRTLYNYADSWYVGANIPGKPRIFMIYIGGFDRYIQRCTEQVANGYEGFVFDGSVPAEPR
ncbi:NAD(P)/FAD-dependent oxidoreductase [Dactylosporangium sp. NPDC000555]|uniref:flavin-containing monooxygenase n=1 Tax=Dactylosporangium sp. NPDC000555 TaxID=3154260 RepID=UPI0033301676